MMAGEVALALMLVVGAGLLASSLVRLYKSGAGFDPNGIQNISFSMDKEPLKGEALMQFYRQLEDGLRRQPTVTSVSFAHIVPFTHKCGTKSSQWERVKVRTFTTTDWAELLPHHGYPILRRSRFQLERYDIDGPKIILNQRASKLLFSDRSPIGQTVTKHDEDTTFNYEVVGVVGDAKYEDLRSPAPPTAYVSMTQDDDQMGTSYNAVVRMSGPPGPLAEAARSLAKSLDSGIPAPLMTSMSATVDDSLSAERADGDALSLLRRLRVDRHRGWTLWNTRLCDGAAH